MRASDSGCLRISRPDAESVVAGGCPVRARRQSDAMAERQRIATTGTALLVTLLANLVCGAQPFLPTSTGPIASGKAPALAPVPKLPQEPAAGTGDSEYGDEFVPFAGERFDGFDWRLCREVNLGEPANAAVSPVGVKLVLALLYEAAAGETARELRHTVQMPARRALVRETFRRVLDSLEEKQAGYVMNVANSVYIDKRYKPRLKIEDHYRRFYGASIQQVDFQQTEKVMNEINNWVSNFTHGHISKLITNGETLMQTVSMILNVIYFKGKWLHAFPASDTTKGQFFINTQKSVTVDYMHLTALLYYSQSQELDANILRLPYQGKKYSMFIVLPNKPENFNKMLEIINPILVREQMFHLRREDVQVILPKFKFDYTVTLKDILTKIGIKQAFSENPELNLVQGDQKFQISRIIQKVGLEITEEGTTASSATEMDIADKFGGPPQKIVFNASHPFMFFIEDEKTGTVVFVGKIVDPTNSPIAMANYPKSPSPANNILGNSPNQPNDEHPVVLPKSVWDYLYRAEWISKKP